MDKRILQTFSVWAKDNLEKQIEVSLKTLGINSNNDIKKARVIGDFTVIEGDDKSYPKSFFGQRESIITLVKNEGYENVIEQFAYTWFNRLVALRFMEIHDFIPHGFRVLSSRDGGVEPEILKNLNFVKDELKLDMELCFKLKDDGKIEELYRYVLFRQCKALSSILPMLFEAESSHLELLLPKNLLKGETVLTKLLEIPEEYFVEDVEIIGWLYQFYVASDRQAFRDAKVVTKDLIPTLTQVFTPDWIVRYMTENSLGRLWLESYPDSSIKYDMKYYVKDANQPEEIARKIQEIKYTNVNPEEIKVIEPCCGSGHILVYIFDLLFKMYEEKGYQKRDISTLILKKNIVGLEIDKRAAQLASFLLVMKARSMNPRFFSDSYYVRPQVFEIWDSRKLIAGNYKYALEELNLLSKDEISEIEYLVETFKYAKTIGSLLIIKPIDEQKILSILDKIEKKAVFNVLNNEIMNDILRLVKILLAQAKVMSAKYDVMITNPPYLGISSLESHAKEYLTANYPDSKSDMFAMFMEAPYVKKNGFKALVNPDSWMFLVSYEKLRKKLIHTESIVNMIHLGMGAFDATVQTTSFVIRNSAIAGNGVYFRLVDEKDKESSFVNNLLTNEGGVIANQLQFSKIPGCPFAYWAGKLIIEIFDSQKTLDELAVVRNGLKTGDNNQFVRFWFEISEKDSLMNASDFIQAMYSGKSWFPYNKGGEFRKWYGNNDYVVNWKNKGQRVIGCAKQEKRNVQDYPDSYKFSPIITWSLITSYKPSFRYKECAISDISGMSLYQLDMEDIPYLLGLVNSKVCGEILEMFNPTMNFQAGDIGRMPIIFEKKNTPYVKVIVNKNIEFSKKDWDSFETSWDFKKHPLL